MMSSVVKTSVQNKNYATMMKDMKKFTITGKITWRILGAVVWFFLIFTKADAQSYDSLALYLSQNEDIPYYLAQAIAIYPHDPRAFTEGLVYENGFLYESTGLHGESSLRKVNLSTGEIIHLVEIEDQYFGEGLTIVGSTLIQLTWKSRVALLYHKDNLEPEKTLYYPYEGWGVTYDGSHLIVSDGSNLLRFLNPVDFSIIRELTVSSRRKLIYQLKELENINCKIYANVWHTDIIAIIDSQDGEVVGWIDVSQLEEKRNTREDVPNGIAYDAENNRLFVTGKRWSHVYEIQLPELIK